MEQSIGIKKVGGALVKDKNGIRHFCHFTEASAAAAAITANSKKNGNCNKYFATDIVKDDNGAWKATVPIKEIDELKAKAQFSRLKKSKTAGGSSHDTDKRNV